MDKGSVATFSKLQPHHLEVLALVAEHKSSKEIARHLGISPDTVDQRLKRVKSLTGVAGRAEAARLYRRAIEQGLIAPPALSGGLVYQTPALSPAFSASDVSASLGFEDRPSDEGHTLHQSRAAYDAGYVSWPQERSWIAGLLEVGRTNDLSPLARTICIFVMTFLALFSVASVVSLAEGLSRLF